jgi:soluble lytic murein transglycosylase
MHTTRSSIAARALTLTSVIGILGVACSRGSHPRTPTVTDTPSFSAQAVTPTPTAAPADPDLGRKLSTDGNFEAAISVYASVAQERSGQAQQQARLAQAELLVKTGHAQDAVPVLQAYLADAGSAADGSEANYMLASALDDAGDPLHALDGYDRYVAAGGPLVDYARIEQAKLLARLGRTADAEAAAEQVMVSGILPDFKDSFMFSIGKAFEDGGANSDALAWYRRARDAGDDVASALARIGAIEQRAGDPDWSIQYQQAIAAYPESAVAPSLIGELDAASVPVSDYVRGVVAYRAGNDIDARAALGRAVAADDHAAAATYYIAAVDERDGDTSVAITEYQQAHDIDPASPLADSALWWRGRLLEQASRTDEAAATYQALVDGYPASKWATDAAFHRGLALFRGADYAGAASAWAVAVTSSDAESAVRARFWRARALLAEHDDQAKPLLQQIVDDTLPGSPGSYYALRAEVLLGKNDTKDREPKIKDYTPDWSKVAKYIQDTMGFDPETASGPPEAQWDAAAALEDVGLHAQSDAVFRQIIKDSSENAGTLFQITRRLQQEGRTSAAARAATTLATLLTRAGTPPPPDDLLRVAYPLAYSDLASSAAGDAGVSPTLLLALVRQESFYDPAAGSSAGALGLTQVIPATGESIAATLGSASFTASDLYRPNVSLKFGASYLSDQLRQFDGDSYRALAAYNGGPGAASSAADSAGTDEDLFVEDLEFDETRDYVRLVLENYARYRQLYEGVGRPSLPR